MTVAECEERLENLRELDRVYGRLYYDVKSCFYKCKSLQRLRNKAKEEASRLEELMYNQELDDSYDQNTGELNEKLYRL